MFTFVSQGRKGRKAQTEKGYREGKHGGEVKHAPHSDDAILSVLGCENPCRECDPTEKPIPQLFEDVCKVKFFSIIHKDKYNMSQHVFYSCFVTNIFFLQKLNHMSG